ncbi:hypothetical protein BDV95DRAFT_667306 [Massariosphaeria phaeospora]|uniref:Necrosis-inducing factor-domain-containing protein n=1 Tax=Massariosphaeria phaeospora TaxID=100035 RepID=A0A7C8I702_9PLEO|nr:hypothetical protein BDV95DRAFT_667306 [Massariosphaeria phaeospora]
MQPSTLLAILATTATASAKCFNQVKEGTAFWGSHDIAMNFVDEICNSGNMAGYFEAGQAKQACSAVSLDGRINWLVKWTDPESIGGLTLNDDDCKLRLKQEISMCLAGGSTTHNGWEFMSDPNFGTC